MDVTFTRVHASALSRYEYPSLKSVSPFPTNRHIFRREGGWCYVESTWGALQESDINTKSLPLSQFRFLRELLNGYGLVMLHYPELKMPEAALTRSELIQMYREYRDAEEKRESAADEKKKKAKL